MPKGQRQELRFVCREYRGLEVLCAWIAKGGSTLLGLRGEEAERKQLNKGKSCSSDLEL